MFRGSRVVRIDYIHLNIRFWICRDCFLRPVQWNRSTMLQKRSISVSLIIFRCRKKCCRCIMHNLLSFNIICDISLIINSTLQISSSSEMSRSASNQCNKYFMAKNRYLCKKLVGEIRT